MLHIIETYNLNIKCKLTETINKHLCGKRRVNGRHVDFKEIFESWSSSYGIGPIDTNNNLIMAI